MLIRPGMLMNRWRASTALTPPAVGILSAEIANDGWTLRVRHTLGATAGEWENSGFDRTNGRFLSGGVDQFPLDPNGTPKIVLQVHSAGHNRSGTAAVATTARVRNICATKAKRRPHPNSTQLAETDHGDGSWTVEFALSERVYAADAVQVLSFLPGWKAGADGGTLGSALVTNSSARTPVVPWGGWAVPSYTLVENATTFEVDILAVSHHPANDGAALHQAVAGVRVMATDGTNANYQWLTVRNSPRADGLRCWGGAVDLSGLTAGLITLHYELYPWVGAVRRTTGAGAFDATAHATTITAASTASGFEAPLQIAYDPTGSRYGARKRFVFIDATSTNTANTTTGTNDAGAVVFHTTLSAARSAALSTKPASVSVAVQAARAFLDANPSLNLPVANGVTQGGTRAIDFWEFVLTDGQVHTIGVGTTGSGETTSGREGVAILRSDPEASNPTTTTILRSGTASVAMASYRWLWRDFRLEMGQATLMSGPGQVTILDNIVQTGKTGYETGTNGFRVSPGEVYYVLNCTQFSYGAQRDGKLVRNVNRTRAFGGGSVAVNVTVNDEAGTNRTVTAINFPNDVPDPIAWNVKIYKWTGGLFGSTAITGVFGTPQTTLRHAFVNVLLEGKTGDAAHQIGEYSYIQMQDCLWANCTFVGSRFNWHNETRPFSASGTTVTAGIKDHGLSVGDSITVAGFVSPNTAANGTYTVSAVPSPHRFQYVASGSPGLIDNWSGATVTRNSDSAVFPVVRWPVGNWHTGNTLLGVVFDRNATKQDNWIGDGTQTGAWELLYGVGQRSCVRANRGIASPSNWQYAWPGIRSVNDTDYGFVDATTPAYVNWHGFVREGTDLGDGLGTGDYHPKASLSSRLIDICDISVTDRDIEGSVRGAAFCAGAYEDVP